MESAPKLEAQVRGHFAPDMASCVELCGGKSEAP